MNNIVWLASYPKSGNTWLRMFFENLLNPSNRPADINSISISEIASSRSLFDEFVGIEASDLTQSEIEQYRPEVYRILSSASTRTLYVKAHDAFTYQKTGEPIFPAGASRGAIYILRNPLDVAASMAQHYAKSIDTAIVRMGSESATLSGESGRLRMQIRQRLKSWSTHVLSWTGQTEMPVCVLRYEDMISQPAEAFGAAARFAGLEAEPDAVLQAIQNCSFERLQIQERENGFKERLVSTQTFFRQGQAGAWRQSLSPEQVKRIVARHGEVMNRFGYLDACGEPTL